LKKREAPGSVNYHWYIESSSDNPHLSVDLITVRRTPSLLIRAKFDLNTIRVKMVDAPNDLGAFFAAQKKGKKKGKKTT